MCCDHCDDKIGHTQGTISLLMLILGGQVCNRFGRIGSVDWLRYSFTYKVSWEPSYETVTLGTWVYDQLFTPVLIPG